jgi:hypothetical protein
MSPSSDAGRDVQMQRLHATNPFRSLSWRFERVREIEGGAPPSRWDDQLIRQYAWFYALLGSGAKIDPAEFDSLLPLYEAHRISLDIDLRALLEAYILAGESDEQIARRFDLLPNTVKWFEAMFFHVRDRLEAQTWIVKSIGATLGSRSAVSPDGVLTPEQIRLTLRVFGYFGGPRVLDEVWRELQPGASAASLKDETWLSPREKMSIKVRGVIAAYWLPLMAPGRKLKKLPPSITGGQAKPADQDHKFAGNIKAFLDYFELGAPDAEDDEPPASEKH